MGLLDKAISGVVGGATGGLGAGLASVALGSILGGDSKSPTQSMATTTVAPQYDPVAEAEARRLFEEGQLGQYQTLSPVEQEAIQRGIGMAQAGAPLTSEAQTATAQLLGGAGSFLSPAQNIYQRLGAAPATTSTDAFQQALTSAISPVMERTTSQFARGGRLGSGLFGEALGRGISSAAAPYVLQAQEADINRQMQAAGGLADIGRLGIGAVGTGVTATPAISSLGFEDVQRQLQLGGLLSQEDFMRREQDKRALSEYQQLLAASKIGTNTAAPIYQAPQYSTGDLVRSGISSKLMETGFNRFGDFLDGFGSPQVDLQGQQPVSFVSGTGMPTVNYAPTMGLDFSGLNVGR